MKEQKRLILKLYIWDLLLCCLIWAKPVFAGDQTSCRDASSFGQALMEVTESYPCDSDGQLVIDVKSDQVKDEEGEESAYDQVVEKALDKSVSGAKSYLEEEGYRVEEVSGSQITVSDPYQSFRLIAYGEDAPDESGCVRTIHYKDNYILQYPSKEAAIEAYQKLSDSYDGEIYRDEYLYAEVDEDVTAEDSADELAEDAADDIAEDSKNETAEDSTDGIAEDSTDETLEDAADNIEKNSSEDDEVFSVQSLYEDGESTYLSWGVSDMGLDLLQSFYQDLTLPEVKVAVIDTGVDYTSDYYNGRIINGYDFADNDDDPMPEKGSKAIWYHGSHVAGIVCDCSTDNVKILNIRALNSDGEGTYMGAAAAIYYALQKGADIINLSLCNKTDPVPLIETALKDAADQDVIVCAAAGNVYSDVANIYPASSSYTWAVNCISSDNVYYANSAYGSGIDFCAPGVDICSVGDGAAATKTGTSMASPHIAAAAAMVRSMKPGLTISEVYDFLTEQCRDLGESGRDDYYGWGLVNFTDYVNGEDICRHDFQPGETVTEGCTESTLYSCALCGASYTVTVENHSPGDTLTSDGSCHYRTCSVCGQAVDKEACAPKSGYYIKGSLHYKRCAVCAGIISWTKEEHTTDGDYRYDDDYHWEICSVCGGQVGKTAHSFEIVNETDPTCTEEGSEEKVCSVCGYSCTETLPATGHTVESWESDGEYHWGTCTVCGQETGKEACEILDGTYLSAANTGHWRKCKVCGCRMTATFEEHQTDGSYSSDETSHWQTCTKHSGKVNIAAHTADYSYDENGHTKVCSVCGYVMSEEAAHDFVLTSTVESTQTIKGKEVYTCSVCGYTYEKELPLKEAAEETQQEETQQEENKTQEDKEENAVLPSSGSYTIEYSPQNTSAAAKVSVIKKGKVIRSGNLILKVTGYGTKYETAALIGVKNSKTKILKIPDTVKYSGVTFRITSIANNALKNHKKLTTLTLGRYVKTIGNCAFYNCRKLKTVSLDTALTTIGTKAFYKCVSLKKLTLPKNVKFIKSYAFYGDKNLKTLVIRSAKLTSASLYKKAFAGTKKSLRFKVPAKKVKSYKTLFKKKGAKSKKVSAY